MLTLVVLIAVTTGVALARGGSLEALASTRFRWAWLILLGLVLQLGAGLWNPASLSSAAALGVVLISNALIAVFLLRNRNLPGVGLAAAGMLMNVTVIASNGAMPVSGAAADAAGVEKPPAEAGIKHERMTEDTVLPWLSDVIPIPVLKEVLSAGDLVLNAGLARLLYVRTRGAGEDG